MAQPSVQGSFVWQELVTADTAAAGSFYPKVLGWRSQNSPHSSSYTMFSAASGPIAGMMRLTDELRQKGVPPHWLPYIGADEVDATVAAAERLGAKVQHAPSDIENNIGRFAVLTDPQGAAFGVYRPGQPMPGPAKGAPAPGHYSWHELATSDAEAAFEFYSKLFGWQAMQRMDMGAAGTYLIFGRDGAQRGGMYKLSRSGAPHWLSYIEVASADAAAAAARDAGAKVLNGPMDVPGGRIAQLSDPAGALFAVHASAKAAAHPTAEKKPAQSTAAQAGAASKAAAPRPTKPAESGGATASSAASGRGDGSQVTRAAPGASSAQSKPSAAVTPPSGASARPASSGSAASSGRGAQPAAAKKAAAKKAGRSAAGKKAAAKRAAGKRPAGKKAAGKKAAGRRSAGGRVPSKKAGRAGGAARKSSGARRAAKSARRAGGGKAVRKSAAKSGRGARRGGRR